MEQMNSRREEIVQAATAIAAERGVRAMSVRAVAARAGIGSSTMRHYFPTQDELFHEVVGRSFHANLANLDIHDTAVPADERLIACVAQFLPADDDQVRMLEGWIALYADAFGPSHTDQGARLLDSLTAHARDRVTAWLDTLDAEGALQPANPALHVTVMLALVDGLCLALLASKHITAADAHATLAAVITKTVITAPT